MSAIHILLITVALSGLAALVRLLAALSTLLPALLALLLSGLLAGFLLILALLLLLALLARLLARLVVLVHAFLRGWVLPAHCENRFRFPLVPDDPRVPEVSLFPPDICLKMRRACFRGCNMA